MAIEITYAVLLMIIGGLLGILGIAVVKKKDTRKIMGWIGGIGFGLGLVAMIGIIPQLSDTLDGTVFGRTTTIGGTDVTFTQPRTTQQAPSGICAVEDTTVTLSATDKYTSVAAGTSHRYKINGAPALNISNAGTFTASPGDELSILWGDETDGSYYGAVSNDVVPCSGTKTFTTELGKNDTVTIQVFNEEDLLMGDGTNNETLAAGDTVTLKMKIKGTYQSSIPYGGVMIVEMNDTVFDDAIIDFGLPETSVPSVYSRTYGADSITKAYGIPAIESNEILVGTIYLDVDDTTGPGILTEEEVQLEFRPNDYFINEDTGGSYDGPAPEDEDDTATFGLISTAKVYTI